MDRAEGGTELTFNLFMHVVIRRMEERADRRVLMPWMVGLQHSASVFFLFLLVSTKNSWVGSY